MGAVITRTPDQMIDEADRILAAAGTPETWPQGRDSQASVAYARDRLLECIRDYYAVLDGSLDPLSVGAPDAGLWSDPEASAIWWTADQALEQAKAMRNRLEGARADERRCRTAAPA